jgi:hypothetical protein
MSNKVFYGILGALGLGALGTIIYSSVSNDDQEPVTADTESFSNVVQKGGKEVEVQLDEVKTERKKKKRKEKTEVLEEIPEDETEVESMGVDFDDMYRIEFLNPNKWLPQREKNSKLLDPTSALYDILDNYRMSLENAYGSLLSRKRMDFHIELIKKGEEWSEELLVHRAQELEGSYVDLSDEDNWHFGGRSVQIKTSPDTHITIGYFKKGVPDNVQEVLFDMGDDDDEDDEEETVEDEVENEQGEDEDEDEIRVEEDTEN